MKKLRRIGYIIATSFFGLALLAGCAGTGSSTTSTSPSQSVYSSSKSSPSKSPSKQPTTPTTAVAAGSAAAVLQTLEVKGRGPKTGYSRDQFGNGWLDLNHDGCQTRDEVLRRDLTNTQIKSGCTVLSGTLNDPYTGKTILFTRGVTSSLAVQIDHVVALSDAWQKNAAGWSVTKREQFANDMLNLLAVDGPANGQKSDGDAATWLPPNKSFRCTYVARQIAVKAKYGVSVTQAEKDAMSQILSTCPGEKLPTG